MFNSLKGILGCLSLITVLASANALPSNVESRIINGTQVTWNSTRYQVSVRLEAIDRLFFGAGHLCGGALVASNVVLTASHCIWNDSLHRFRTASEYTVVMGSVDRTMKYGNTLKIPVREILMTSNVDPSIFRDDFAILILNQSVPENYTGATIIQMNENRTLPEGTKCTVSGWGVTEKGSYTRNLMSVEVPIISRAVCSRNYGSQSLLNGMLCAGYMNGGRDACTGDSGGPLVCNNKLVGLVSFGIGCAMSGYPGVYVDVAYYVDWIRNQTGLLQKQDFNINAINDYYYYNIAKNSTGSSNSTKPNSSVSILYGGSNIIWFMMPLICVVFKLF